MALQSAKMCCIQINLTELPLYIFYDRLHYESTESIFSPALQILFVSFIFLEMTHSIIYFFIYFFYSGGPISGGSQRTFWGVGNHAAVSVVGLGDAKSDWDELEKIDGVKENIRIAVAGKHFLYLQIDFIDKIARKNEQLIKFIFFLF